ncbi:hypothetical protein [Chitinophaga pinensis]|uniref:Uncharacterized protein n=1 Tax=Chitinophaga pinensis (strain ATCC 43595 / DSM 2588 / LMG 13176 / NBRC 15968 / NCIMB 11800 / UQM 2034) TaxID=485918 RepID=A0A979GVU1_CHIPD|nr:hypothetical protein [Chitinophaga pinensis]ACU61326.1 hypothetical protein Cpin_3864 [Chitinophaga pinensis DSM 2588]
MEGTVTAKDKYGNVLLTAVFSDRASRKALEIFIKALYGIQHYSTTITPRVEEESNLVKPSGLGNNDYWLPDISGSGGDGGEILRKVI